MAVTYQSQELCPTKFPILCKHNLQNIPPVNKTVLNKT